MDAINPGYYRDGLQARRIQCIDVTRHLPFAAGNAVKYLWRAGNKGDYAEDLDKAEWYLAECRENPPECDGRLARAVWELVERPPETDEVVLRRHLAISSAVYADYEGAAFEIAGLRKALAERG